MHDLAIVVDSGGMMVGFADIDSQKELWFHRVPSSVRSNTRPCRRLCDRSHPRYTAPQQLERACLLAIRTNQTGSGQNTPLILETWGQLSCRNQPPPDPQ